MKSCNPRTLRPTYRPIAARIRFLMALSRSSTLRANIFPMRLLRVTLSVAGLSVGGLSVTGLSFTGLGLAGLGLAAMGPAVATEVAAADSKLPLSNADAERFGLEFAPPKAVEGDRRERLSGQVRVPPDAVSVVTTPMEGLIVRTHVADGMPVEPGDALVTLTSPELIRLESEYLNLREEQAYLGTRLERDRNLAEAGAIARQRLEESALHFEQARRKTASARLRLKSAGVPAEALEALESNADLSQEFVLRAPHRGVVSELTVGPGERATALTPLLHLTRTARLWIEFEVPLSIAESMREGESVRLAKTGGHVDPMVDTVVEIVTISRMVSDNRNLVLVRCAVPDASTHTLRPGQFVVGHWEGAAAALFAVPESAIVHEGDMDFLFVALPDGVQVTPVEVVTRSGGEVRIRATLSPADRVVTRGTAQLKSLWLADEGDAGAGH
jgi:RND family efflux transporter MFP subunit